MANANQTGNVWLQMPTSRQQPEFKKGISYLLGKRVCNFEQCPLCSRQANRDKPVPLQLDPDYIRRVEKPDPCAGRSAMPSAAPTSTACSGYLSFNASVLVFVWLMVAFWVSMLVMSTLDTKSYLVTGRQGFWSYFASYELFKTTTRSDSFSLICILFCVINIVMVLFRLVTCGPVAPPPPPSTLFQIPQGMQAYNLPQRDEYDNNYDEDDEDEDDEEGASSRNNIDLTFDHDPCTEQNSMVLRSNQFLAQPAESTATSCVSSFVKYGPGCLKMGEIVKHHEMRLSQSGVPADKVRATTVTCGQQQKSAAAAVAGKGTAKKSPLKTLKLPLIGRSKKKETKEPTARVSRGSVPPVLGRGKPEDGRQLDRLGRRVNRKNDSYVPADSNAFLSKATAGDGCFDTDPCFLGRLKTAGGGSSSKNDDENAAAAAAAVDSWKDGLAPEQREWLKQNQADCHFVG